MMDMERTQVIQLLDSINLEISDPQYHLDISQVELCLDKCCIDYEELEDDDNEN